MSLISRRRDVMQGLPCVRGTRIPVRAVKSFAAAGYSIPQIIREYPDLTAEQVAAAIAYGRPPQVPSR
jgi:uncharacterized protein (DUF433 family)